MKQLIRRATALALCAFVGLGLIGAPSASAGYGDPLGVGDPIQCGGDFHGRIIGGFPGYTVEYTLVGNTTITRTFNVAAEGPYVLSAAGVPPGAYTITIKVTDAGGGMFTTTFNSTVFATCGTLPPPQGSAGAGIDPLLLTIQERLAAEAAARAAAAAAAQKPLPPAPALAVTGSDVNLPVAAGFSLIGAGGLALLAARKRQLRQG